MKGISSANAMESGESLKFVSIRSVFDIYPWNVSGTVYDMLH